MQFRLIIYADITMQGIQRIEMCNSSTNFIYIIYRFEFDKKIVGIFAPV